MDINAYTSPFQFTKSLRREVYPAIDPKNSAISGAGKNILITGATGGLGGEVARAWATANAKGIVLLGRNTSLLEEPIAAIKSINPSTRVLSFSVDIDSEEGLRDTFEKAVSELGPIDVVVHAAGSMVSGPVGDLEPNAWFKDFEVNVKGSYNVVHAHLNTSPSGGTVIFLNSLGSSFTIPGMSAYSGSKMALVKLAEYLHAEKPNLRVFTIHPGIVGVTETNRGMVVDSLTPFAYDKGIQTGGLSLYLASSQGEYLRGSLVSVNWDVEEMAAHKDEILEKKLLQLAFLNAKLGPEGHTWSN